MATFDLTGEQVEEIRGLVLEEIERLEDDNVHWNIEDDAEFIALRHRQSVLDEIIKTLEGE